MAYIVSLKYSRIVQLEKKIVKIKKVMKSQDIVFNKKIYMFTKKRNYCIIKLEQNFSYKR